jgi:hypothetical protein
MRVGPFILVWRIMDLDLVHEVAALVAESVGFDFGLVGQRHTSVGLRPWAWGLTWISVPEVRHRPAANG